MIPVEEARARILADLHPLPAEQISLADAFGRVLAEDLAARRTQPPTAVSAMDGYAVRADDITIVPARLRVIGSAPAGVAFNGRVNAGEAVRIFTGGPLPDGANTVVIQENVDTSDGEIVVNSSAVEGAFMRPAGLDFKEGQILLEQGRILTARDIGLAAAMNVPWLMVRRRPRVAILATGDEIVMPGEFLGPNQIVSSNGPALAALVRTCGGVPVSLGVAADNPTALKVRAAAASGADLLITSGGASVGEHDIVQRVLGEAGLKVDFWRVAMRPGKPLIFGHLDKIPMIGVPGNPVSALVCGVLFVRPALERLLGVDREKGPPTIALLGSDLPANDQRQDYLRASLSHRDDGQLVATPFEQQDSSMFLLMARADCLVVRPPDAPAANAGSRVEIIHLVGGRPGT